MSDTDMMAAMGFGGFGKKQNKRALDPKRFDKGKRDEVMPGPFHFVCASISRLILLPFSR